jgi:hypothetical protein
MTLRSQVAAKVSIPDTPIPIVSSKGPTSTVSSKGRNIINPLQSKDSPYFATKVTPVIISMIVFSIYLTLN